MTDQQIRTALQAIYDAGRDGLVVHGGYTDEQKYLVDKGYAYMPLNVWRRFGKVNRLQITRAGRILLSTPEPKPAPEPKPEPTPASPPVPDEPETPPVPVPDREPDPEPVVPPVDGKDGLGERLVEPPEEPTPEPVAQRRADYLVELQGYVKEVCAASHDMEQVRTVLRGRAGQMRADGMAWDGTGKRQVLSLTKRNAAKWAGDPQRYALLGVDE